MPKVRAKTFRRQKNGLNLDKDTEVQHGPFKRQSNEDPVHYSDDHKLQILDAIAPRINFSLENYHPNALTLTDVHYFAARSGIYVQ